METRSLNKVEMFAQVITVCRRPEYADAVRAIPGFEADALSFQDLQPSIRDFMGTSVLLSSTSATLDKDALRARLADAAVKVSGALVNAAERLGDAVLAQDAHLTKSQLLTGRGTEASLRVDRLLELASSQLATRREELARYGLTEERLDELEARNEQFSTSIGLPRRVIRERKIANRTLPDLLRQADAILARMDRACPILEETHPDFVTAYRESRQIVRIPATRDVTPAAGAGATSLPRENASPGTSAPTAAAELDA